MLTLLAAGHETTATTLAWAVERLRRHPRLLIRLTAEVDAGGSELLQATIFEVQRTRPVIDATGRVTTRANPVGRVGDSRRITSSSSASRCRTHPSRTSPTPEAFNPDRFVGGNPDTHAWIPFGGGIRRCIGAAFANMEMKVTLRTLLREFEFGTTYAAGEPIHSRGVATAPARGGRAVVYRRKARVEISRSQHVRAGVGVTAHEHVVDVGRGIELCYDQIGDPNDPPIVLIAGLGQQLHVVADDFAGALAGTRLPRDPVRQPRRRAGRRTWTFPPPKPLAVLRGGNHPRQYHLGDMARDTVGLLDALGYRERAPGRHLDGRHDRPDRRRALSGPGAHADVDHVDHRCAAHRTSGAVDLVADGDRQAAAHPRTRRSTRDVAIFRHIGSHGFPFDEAARAREGRHRLGSRSDHRGHAAAARGHLRVGRPHRRTRSDRRADAGDPRRPGPDGPSDRGRRDRARHSAVRGWRRSRGMGHDLPAGAWERLLDLIADHVASAPVTNTELEETR